MEKRVAVVYDTLFTYAGGERILEHILNTFQGADLHAIANVLPLEQRAWLGKREIRYSYLQRWPFLKSAFRHYAWAMPAAVEAMDMSGYDLVVSCTYAFSNGVLTDASQKHLNYLTARPLKYVFDERADFIKPPLLPLKASIARDLRQWAKVASSRPDRTLTVSDYVGSWMARQHGVTCTTVYPPVETEFFNRYAKSNTRQDYYVTTSRLQKYKKVDILVQAFNEMKKKLVIIGSGPEEASLKAMAGDTVQFVGYRNKAEIADIVSRARAFVFASNEDFGMAMVEAQACGTPLIAYGKAGALEINHAADGELLGEFFERQTKESVIDAVERFEGRGSFNRDSLLRNVQRFSLQAFGENIRAAAENL